MDVEGASSSAHLVCVCCHGQVPDDEIVVPEATNYLVHFCGLECYAVWRATTAGLFSLPEGPA